MHSTALSMFTGKILKRYADDMDPAPVLQYVANQLRRNSTVDLIVLQEIITSMAGIVSEQNLNDHHLQALAGGEVLRQQVLASFQDRRTEARSTTHRLMKSLVNRNLTGELLILMAQQRQHVIADGGAGEGGDMPLKVLGNLFDEIHNVLAMYLELLNSGLSRDKWLKEIPDLKSLCMEYGLEPAIAWWISRGSIVRMMRLDDDRRAKEAKSIAPAIETNTVTDADGDLHMTVVENGVKANGIKPVNVDGVLVKDEDTPMQDPDSPVEEREKPDPINIQSSTTSKVVKKLPWHPVLEKVMHDIQDVAPSEVWTKFSLPFYTTFWQLSIYDVFVPMASYENEISGVRDQILALDKDRSDRSSGSSEKRREERERLMNLNEKLQSELKAHIKNHRITRKRLSLERDHWFIDERFKPADIVSNFIQYCVWPRILLSPNDASFCAKFIRQLHGLGTPKFSTLGVYDNIFGKNLATAIFMCTQREAENYGRFLNEILTDLHAWHADKKKYEQEAHGNNLPGFQAKGQPLDWEDFRKLLYKWHKNLNSAFKLSFSSSGVGKTGAPGEFMRIRNAFIVLKCIAPNFPRVEWIGKTMLEKVQMIANSDKREDLKIAAVALVGILKRGEKGGRERKGWMLVPEFQKVKSKVENLLELCN